MKPKLFIGGPVDGSRRSIADVESIAFPVHDESLSLRYVEDIDALDATFREEVYHRDSIQAHGKRHEFYVYAETNHADEAINRLLQGYIGPETFAPSDITPQDIADVESELRLPHIHWGICDPREIIAAAGKVLAKKLTIADE